MLIRLKTITIKLSIIIIMLYALSRLSWGIFLPTSVWGVLLAFSVVFAVYPHIGSRHLRISLSDITPELMVVMLMISLLWNNQNFAHGDISYEISFAIVTILYCLVRRYDEWYPTFLKIMILFGVFYAAMTFVCMAIPSIYYSAILPIMEQYGTSYTPAPEAGFTAHYSSNGIFLAIGVCAVLAYAVFNAKGRKRKRFVLLSVLLVAALLMTGKRGTLICLVAAAYAVWFLYMGKRRDKVFWIITVTIVLLICVYIASWFIEPLGNFFARFQEQIASGDISTGRFVLWAEAWERFTQKPLFGHGWRWFRFNSHLANGQDVHNVYLQLLTEVGIVGSIPFFVFFFANVRRAVVLYKLSISKEYPFTANQCRAIAFSLIYQVYFLILSFEGTTMYQVEVYVPYFLSCAIGCYCWRRVRFLKEAK